MEKIILDGNKMQTREEAHAHIAEMLSFPDYYGSNLDALYDCLTDMRRRPVKIVLTNGDRMREALGSYAVPLLDCFTEAFNVHGGAMFREEEAE